MIHVFRRIVCHFVGHELRPTGLCGHVVAQLFCLRCDRMFAHHIESRQLLRWTDEWQALSHANGWHRHTSGQA